MERLGQWIRWLLRLRKGAYEKSLRHSPKRTGGTLTSQHSLCLLLPTAVWHHVSTMAKNKASSELRLALPVMQMEARKCHFFSSGGQNVHVASKVCLSTVPTFLIRATKAPG